MLSPTPRERQASYLLHEHDHGPRFSRYPQYPQIINRLVVGKYPGVLQRIKDGLDSVVQIDLALVRGCRVDRHPQPALQHEWMIRFRVNYSSCNLGTERLVLGRQQLAAATVRCPCVVNGWWPRQREGHVRGGRGSIAAASAAPRSITECGLMRSRLRTGL